MLGTLIASIFLLLSLVHVETRASTHPLPPRCFWSMRSSLAPCALIAACSHAVWQGANHSPTVQLRDFGHPPLSTAVCSGATDGEGGGKSAHARLKGYKSGTTL